MKITKEEKYLKKLEEENKSLKEELIRIGIEEGLITPEELECACEMSMFAKTNDLGQRIKFSKMNKDRK